MSHIIERAVIHFFSSTALTLAVFFALRYWLRRNAKVGRWISPARGHLLVTSALLVWALATLREPFDVATGQSAWKAVTDQLSWLLGTGASAWGLYRYNRER